jgi:predicted DCC family thiol-disulfide oxidoreductase YuxK
MKNIILFDGVCNLCNGSVNFIIKRDPHSKFLFTPMQNKKAKELLSQFHFDTHKLDTLDTLLLIKNEKLFSKSDAVLEITKGLSGYWYILSYLTIIPKPIRDYLYTLLSRNRYKLFGKNDSCMVPTKELKERFLV